MSNYFALLLIWFAAIASPGPDLLQIIRLGARSRANAVWCAIGISTANTGWISLTFAGLVTILAQFTQVLLGITLAGAGYLAYIGVKSIQSGWQAYRSGSVGEASAGQAGAQAQVLAPLSAASAFRTGFITNISNPKAVLFYSAVMAPFLGAMPGTNPIVGAVLMVVTGYMWFIACAWGVSALAMWIDRHRALVELVTGVVFLCAAVGLVIWFGTDVMS